MTNREAYIALNMMEGLGPVRIRNLVQQFGSPSDIFSAEHADLMQAPRIGRELAASIIKQRDTINVNRELKKAEKWGVTILTREDDGYPACLASIHDPPVVLYVKGTLLKKDKHALAIVGTRRPTHYGANTADRLAYQVAKLGFCVVSGLARGIDTAAHRGALKGQGRTIAVLGSAMDQLYPKENAELAKQIAAQGAVISEFPFGRQPDRTTFPYRNRIVSGLSMGVVVVEAGLNSGAMMTADQALDQGRSVFAVPGRIDTSSAKGPHRLIKNGAKLVEDIDDIMQDFEFLLPDVTKKAVNQLDSRPETVLSSEEQQVVKALWEGPVDVDTLTRTVNITIVRMNTLLIGMELKRLIRMRPGRVVELAEGMRSYAETL